MKDIRFLGIKINSLIKVNLEYLNYFIRLWYSVLNKVCVGSYSHLALFSTYLLLA